MPKWIVVLGVCALLAGCGGSDQSVQQWNAQMRATSRAKQRCPNVDRGGGTTRNQRHAKKSAAILDPTESSIEDDGSYFDS